MSDLVKREENKLAIYKQPGAKIAVKDCVSSVVLKDNPYKKEYIELIAKGIAKMFYAHGKQFSDVKVEAILEPLIDTYEWESAETILLFLKKAAAGDFGKFFGEPDIGTIREWFADFLLQSIIPERERQNTFKERDTSDRGQARSVKEVVQGSKKNGVIFIPDRFRGGSGPQKP